MQLRCTSAPVGFVPRRSALFWRDYFCDPAEGTRGIFATNDPPCSLREPSKFTVPLGGFARQGVGLPRKYLGHGVCDARSKLLNLRRSTADAETLISHALQLLKECKVPPDKIRGIGVQMTRLDSTVDTGGGRGSKNGGALNAWLMRAGEEEDSDPLSSLEQNHSSADVGENETALLQDSAPNALRGSQPHSPDRGAASQTMRPAKPKDRLSHEAGNKRAREVDGEMPGVILRPSIRHRGDCSERAALIVGSAAEDGAVMTQVSRGTNGESRDSEKEEEEEEVAKVANTRVAMEVSAGMSAVVGPVGLATLAPPAKQSHVQALRSDGGIDNIVAGGVASPCTVPRRVPTGSPEPVHPSVRVRRVEGTPPGVACSPSMSQVGLVVRPGKQASNTPSPQYSQVMSVVASPHCFPAGP